MGKKKEFKEEIDQRHNGFRIESNHDCLSKIIFFDFIAAFSLGERFIKK